MKNNSSIFSRRTIDIQLRCFYNAAAYIGEKVNKKRNHRKKKTARFHALRTLVRSTRRLLSHRLVILFSVGRTGSNRLLVFKWVCTFSASDRFGLRTFLATSLRETGNHSKEIKENHPERGLHHSEISFLFYVIQRDWVTRILEAQQSKACPV